jgi:hypothetical protein
VLDGLIRLLPHPPLWAAFHVTPLIRLLPRSLTLPGLPIYVARFPAAPFPRAPFTPGTIIWVRARTCGLKGVMGAWSDPAKLMVV